MLSIIPIVRAAIIPENLDPSKAGFSDLLNVFNNIADLVLIQIMPAAAFAVFAYAGFLYVTSGGDEKKTKAAMAWIRNGIIGVIIAFSAVLAIRTAISLLGLEGQPGISPFEETQQSQPLPPGMGPI